MDANKSLPDEPLPPILAEIASIVGREAALKIAEERGGTRTYFPRPQRLHRSQWLVQLIGIELARRLCEEFAGGLPMSIEIPHGPTSDRATRQRLIDTLILSGTSTYAIANQVGADRKTVRLRKARLRNLGILSPRSSSNERQKP